MRKCKHGQSHTRLYNVWRRMKERCNNPTSKSYENYGGRGITVCNEWLEFTNFYEWSMLNGYKQGLTIDRIDNNKGYYPNNCRWTTYSEQNMNRRNTKLIQYKGEVKPAKKWAEEFGFEFDRFYKSLWYYDYSIEKVLQNFQKKGIYRVKS